MIDETLMALMVAGAIEASNTKDGKLMVEIMKSSRGLKGSLTAIYEIGLECIGADETVEKVRYASGWWPEVETVSRNELKASQRKAWAKACGVAEK